MTSLPVSTPALRHHESKAGCPGLPSLPQTCLLALEPHICEKRVQPRAPGPSNSDLWESPWLTHDSHKGPTVQGFPELQALRQSPTELLMASPSDKKTQVPSPPPGRSELTRARIPHSWGQI